MEARTIPFFRPSIGEDEINEVVDCLRNGWLTTGAKSAKFERDFSALFDDGVDSIAVNSATAALHLGLEALGVGPGDEVIVPTFTFTATAEVVRYLGATPVFVDCDLDSFNIGPAQIEPAISPRTKVIMPVHFAGLACDMKGIRALADQHGLKILDDAAHALPTYHDGKLIGDCYADVTAFSFYANKTMTTGEGGMLTTRDPALAQRARHMRLHGINRDVFNRFTDTKASWQYDIVAPGYKYNLTDIAAAMGLHQLKKIVAFKDARKALCDRYSEKLAGLPLILPAVAKKTGGHSHHLYIVRVTDGAVMNRNDVIVALQAAGIGVSVHYRPLHRMTYWQETFGLTPEAFPNADAIGETCISLPLFPGMSEDDQDYVIATLRGLLAN